MMIFRKCAHILAVVFMLAPSLAQAQSVEEIFQVPEDFAAVPDMSKAPPDAGAPAPAVMDAVDKAGAMPGEADAVEAFVPKDANKETVFRGSFMFSQSEIDDIERAKAGIVLSNPMVQQETAVVIPPIRRIILSGIYYRTPADWTVWINGQKVTPGNLLPEIVDIKVMNDRVRLKWFDIGLNGVLSLEMRPHQMYDIVTGVMLRE